MAIVIRRLEEADAVERFDCGDGPLNNYLMRHAWNNQQKSSIGVTYVGLDESAPKTVIGYLRWRLLACLGIRYRRSTSGGFRPTICP